MTNNKGITLIALIITVIILLILAGTAISISINGGNLFEKAATARDTWNMAVANEEEEISKTWQILDGMLPPYKVYTLGQEVVVGGENFFVIEENDDSSKDTITLITKYNLSKTENRQQNAEYTVTAIKFCTGTSSDKGYWYEEGEDANSKYPSNIGYNLNGEVSDNSTRATVYKKAVEYGQAKGGTGRLLTTAEAKSLVANNKIPDIIFGKNYTTNPVVTNNYLCYWLGSALNSFCVWTASGMYSSGSIGNWEFYNNSNSHGIRPVITISKALVTPLTD